MLKNSLLGLIGNTPVVRLKEIEKKYSLKTKLYAKLEFVNPAGSIKDRVALQMIESAENSGALKKGGVIINISSCSAYTSSTNRGEYCISKAGVSMITKLFADRLAPEGITVNEIYGYSECFIHRIGKRRVCAHRRRFF